jgi:hypothetical protein
VVENIHHLFLYNNIFKMITLTLAKQYLNIHPTNTSEDVLIQLLMEAAQVQALLITDADNAAIDLALLKSVADFYLHRENYLDADNGGLILSTGTIQILNKFRKSHIL